MPKPSGTYGFRPTEWEAKAIQAAEQATGKNRSEIIRRCVRAALVSVVDQLNRDHQKAISSFREVASQDTKAT